MIKLPTDWYHAALNLAPTISINISHAGNFAEVVEGLRRSAVVYLNTCSRVPPHFGWGLLILATQCIEHIEQLLHKTLDELDELIDMCSLLEKALIRLCSKASKMVRGLRKTQIQGLLERVNKCRSLATAGKVPKPGRD